MKTITNKRITIFLSIFVLLSLFVKIHLGFDCDEQYAFSMMYRFTQGQRYISDIFDPHQFSALLTTPLFYLCSLLSKQYTVILFRSFSAILYFLGSIPVYLFIKKETNDKQIAFLGLLSFFTLTPKSIISLEHSNLTVLFLTYVLMDCYTYLKYKEINIPLFSIKSVLLAICYPTLILLLVPVLIIFISRKDYKSVIKFLVICFLLALLLIIPPLINAGSFKELIKTVQTITMDGSHQFSITNRISVLFSDNKYALKYLAFYSVFFGGFVCWKHFSSNSWISNAPNWILFCASFFVAGIFQVVFLIASPTAGYIRYTFLMLIAIFVSVKRREQALSRCLLVLLVAIAIMFLTTNNGIPSTAGFCAFSIMAITLLYRSDRKGVSFLLLSIILCQSSYYLFSYHVSGGGPRSVFHSDLVESKIIKEIMTEQVDENYFESCASQEVLSSSGKVMIGGKDSYSYLLVGGEVFAPSTISTPEFGEQWKVYLQSENVKDFDLLIEKSYPGTDNLVNIIRKNYRLRLIYSDDNIDHFVCEIIS